MRSLVPFVLLFACNGERRVDTVDTDLEQLCAGDEECADYEICDDQACVTGDWSVDVASAIPILKTADPTDAPSARGFIQQPGDIDYYAYEATAAQWLRVQTVSGDPDNMDTVVAVLDASGGVHAWVDDFATGSILNFDSVLHVYLPRAGTWYITVQDRSTWFDTEDVVGDRFLSYDLSLLDFTATTTEADSYEAPSSTVEMTSGTSIWTVGVNLEEAGDRDWITVEMPHGDAPVEIWGLEGIVGSEARSKVRLMDPEANIVLDKDEVGPDGVGIYYAGEDVTYTVEATDAFGGGGEDHWYPLYFRTRSEGTVYEAEVEPNDEDNAQALEVTELTTSSNGTPYDRGWVQGALDTDSDEDWFTFPVNAGDWFTFRCEGDVHGSTLDAAAEVYASSGILVDTVTSGNTDMPDFVNHGPLGTADTFSVRLYAEGDTPIYAGSSFYRCVFFSTPFEVATR